MPYLHRLPFALLFCLLAPFILRGQSAALSPFFSREVVSPGHINDLIKTSDGFLWIATQDGLFRHDGYELIVYRPHQGDSSSIPNAFVWTLHEDRQRRLWLGTFGSGLAYYNPRTAAFAHRKLPSAESEVQSIRAIKQGKENDLWLGTEKGLWHFDPDRDLFRKISGATAPDLTIINCLDFLDEDHLLIGAQEGAFIYSVSADKWLPTPLQGRGVASIDTLDGKLWLGTYQGLVEYEYTSKTSDWFQTREVQLATTTLANAVSSVLMDATETFWIGTLDGLFRFNPKKDDSPKEVPTINNYELPDAQFNTILQVEPGLVLTGTRRGLFHFSNTPSIFHHLSQTQLGNNFCSNVVLGCTEDLDGNWWLGTQGGLALIRPSYEKEERIPKQFSVQCLKAAEQVGMPEDYIINTRVMNNEHWVTFWRGGLRKMEKNVQNAWQFSDIPGLKELTNNAGIHDVLIDQTGDTWIATPNRGLVRWDRNNDSLQVYEPGSDSGLLSPYVFHLHQDQERRLWAGTANGGLCYKMPTDSTFICFVQKEEQDSSLSNNLVLSVFEDRRGHIWACTAGGLNRWLEGNKFEAFTSANGLPSDIVYGMLQEQDSDAYWLSTNAGLVRMNYVNDQWNFQTFQASDGLQGNEFNQYAFFQTERGLLCFGGPQGLTYFDPAKVGPDTYTAPVVLTDFQLFNQSQTPGALLPFTINETKKIDLKHNQNFLAFEFAALGYSQTDQQTYAYQLLGIDRDWVYSDSRRYASYPKLPPGAYTLLLKAANHDGVWGPVNKALQIQIHPPWWQRWWAYLAYSTVLASIGFLLFQNRLRALRSIDQARLQEREAFRKKTARDFHDEAGNKISKMSLLTEVVKRQTQAIEVQPMLQQLEQTIQELRLGMRDFIWVLDPQFDNLYDTLLRLKIFGQELFEHSDANFTFQPLPDDWAKIRLASPVRRHLLLIGKEALHNSLKHARAKQVEVSFEKQGSGFIIRFRDNGQGWDTSQVGHQGNGLRNMQDRAQKIGGKMEIISTPGNGSCTELNFRITHMED